MLGILVISELFCENTYFFEKRSNIDVLQRPKNTYGF